MTGRKEEQLLFRKHSMFPGGLKETPYKAMKKKNPDEVRGLTLTLLVTDLNPLVRMRQIIRHAVSGMLPKNKLRERRLERLKIFPGHHMGIVGANIMRSWEDGTLPPDFNPSTPTTSETLKKLKEHRKQAPASP